jgi:predicted transposase YdaD
MDNPVETLRMIQEKLGIVPIDPDLMRAYERYEKAASDWTSGINGARREGEKAGMIKGEQIGMVKGEKAKAMEVGRKLKSRGDSLDEIADVTGLDTKTIEGL